MNITNLLFDTPWWLPTGLALVGGGVFYIANIRRQSALRSAGVAVVLVAIALALVSYFVDTPREQAEKDSRRFVQAFVDKDWTLFEDLLDRKVALSAEGISSALYPDRESLVRAAQAAQSVYDFSAIHITSIEARDDRGLIGVTLKLYSEQQATLGRPFPSMWEFQWQDFGSGYKLSRITAIMIADQSPRKLQNMFPRN